MAQNPETIFKEKVLKQLATLPRSYFFKIQQMARVGDPDLVGTLNGRSVYIELKRSAKAKIDRLQVYNLHRGFRAGAYSFVAYPENWEEVFSFLKELSQKPIIDMETPQCLKLPSVI